MTRSILPEDLTESAGRRASALDAIRITCDLCGAVVVTMPGWSRCDDCAADEPDHSAFDHGRDDELARAMEDERCGPCYVCDGDPCVCDDPTAAATEEQLAERRSYRSLRDTPAGQAAALALQAYRETQVSRPAARAGIVCRTPRQRRMFAKSNAQAQEGN